MTRISVCAPYWCRQDALDHMVEMYASLYPDLDIELSVCDDGSPEPAVVPDHVTLTRLPEKAVPKNPCVPINRAVEASSGDVIALTNPEIEHPKPVLPDMLAALESEDDYVTAACRQVGGRRDGQWLAGPSNRAESPVPPNADFHFLALFRRSLWKHAGGFDEEYRDGIACDDNDWLWRAYEAGAQFRKAGAVVLHHRRERVKWAGRPNHHHLARKWPPERRRSLIQARESE